MRKIGFFILLAFLAVSSLFAQQQERRRGKYLRTEIRKTDRQETFSIGLVDTKTSFPTLVFRRKTILTHHEVRLYEVLLEVVKPNDGNGITPRGTVEYLLVPGETIEGEEVLREEVQDGGPLAKANLSLNGTSIQTDELGQYVDSRQLILEQLDDIRVKSVAMNARHEQYGEQKLQLSRVLLKRQNAEMPGLERPLECDLLEHFGQDYTQLRASGTEGLTVKLTCPDKGRRGESVAVTVEASNAGPRPVCNLLGRIFSSSSGLDGKLFYFGTIAPGKSVTFSRMVTLPEAGTSTHFAMVSFWSILGPLPEKACRIQIKVGEK